MSVPSIFNAFAVFIFTTASAWAEGCACTIFPFEPEPPCFEECAAKLLLEADADRLEAVLDLTPATTLKLEISRHKGAQQTSLEGLSIGLEEEEKNYIFSKIRNLSQEDFEYLRESMHVPQLR